MGVLGVDTGVDEDDIAKLEKMAAAGSEKSLTADVHGKRKRRQRSKGGGDGATAGQSSSSESRNDVETLRNGWTSCSNSGLVWIETRP